MRAPNFRSVGPTVQPVEHKKTDTQTDTQTDRRTLPKILPLPLTREVITMSPIWFESGRANPHVHPIILIISYHLILRAHALYSTVDGSRQGIRGLSEIKK